MLTTAKLRKVPKVRIPTAHILEAFWYDMKTGKLHRYSGSMYKHVQYFSRSFCKRRAAPFVFFFYKGTGDKRKENPTQPPNPPQRPPKIFELSVDPLHCVCIGEVVPNPILDPVIHSISFFLPSPVHFLSLPFFPFRTRRSS